MPTPSPIRKLLKEHQAKYAALTEAESRGIMEEILSMKIGISADASVEDNEEAEQMIRAITHGDIDNSVSCGEEGLEFILDRLGQRCDLCQFSLSLSGVQPDGRRPGERAPAQEEGHEAEGRRRQEEKVRSFILQIHGFTHHSTMLFFRQQQQVAA